MPRRICRCSSCRIDRVFAKRIGASFRGGTVYSSPGVANNSLTRSAISTTAAWIYCRVVSSCTAASVSRASNIGLLSCTLACLSAVSTYRPATLVFSLASSPPSPSTLLPLTMLPTLLTATPYPANSRLPPGHLGCSILACTLRYNMASIYYTLPPLYGCTPNEPPATGARLRLSELRPTTTAPSRAVPCRT